jgi:hypothetical protein
MVMPAPVSFAGSNSQGYTPAARDIALSPGGLLVGQVLNDSMKPVRGVKVAILADGHTTAVMETDADGMFAVAGLRGGVHQVATETSMETCRLWAAGTAPPGAESHLRFVPGQATLVRGQWGPPEPTWKTWATNPYVIGGVVATAVAVPVIIFATDDDDDEGS